MPTEAQKSIRLFLSLFLSDDELDPFLDAYRVSEALQQGARSWEHFAAAGAHLAAMRAESELDETDAARDLARSLREPVARIVDELMAKAEEAILDEEDARMLFHALFALGLIFLRVGEPEAARGILLKVSGTKVSRRGWDRVTAPEVLECTADVYAVKWEILYAVLAGWLREKRFEELIYVLIEARACDLDLADVEIMGDLPAFFDLWAGECEKKDDSGGDTLPTRDWIGLFSAAAVTWSVLGLVDWGGGSEESPSECSTQSPSWLAWRFGQLVGRFCTHKRWRPDPFRSLDLFGKAGWTPVARFWRGEDDYESVFWTRAEAADAMSMVACLVADYSLGRGWEQAREQYLAMWRVYYGDGETERGLEYASPTDAGYWAMRVGFFDALFRSLSESAVVSSVNDELDSIRTSAERASLETIKVRSLIEGNLLPMVGRVVQQPSVTEAREHILAHLGPMGQRLPASVINALVQAEMYYETLVKDDEAKVAFAKAVEASLYDCLVRPLLEFMRKRQLHDISIPFSPERGGVRRKTSEQIERMYLPLWVEAVDIVLSSLDDKGLAALSTRDLRAFLEEHVGRERLPELRSLIAPLRNIQKARGGSAHYQPAQARFGAERLDLERMRALTLGIGSPSVIVRVFELMGQRN